MLNSNDNEEESSSEEEDLANLKEPSTLKEKVFRGIMKILL